MNYVIIEKARKPGAHDLRKRKRRVINWYNDKEGAVQKVGDHIRYTVAGPESVREIKVKWDDGTTEWEEPAHLVDKETGKHLHKMAKHEIEGED